MKPLQHMKTLIIGLGQIGGSLGLDLVSRKLVAEVLGYDREPSITAEARQRAAIHTAAPSLDEGLRRADLAILAVPLREIVKLLPAIAPLINTDKVLLDVGSTKSEILSTIMHFELGSNYIGGHPLTGSEKHGLAAARTGKFANTTFVLTPTAHTPGHLLQLAKALVIGLEAQPVIMTAEEHDHLIALTSNLPYLISIALTRLAGIYAEQSNKIWDIVGGSFKSATRVAASSPQLTLDMFLTNRANIPRVVDELITQLSLIKDMVQDGDEDSLRSVVVNAREMKLGTQHG